MVRKHVFISGIVQGVYYRDHTKRQADRLGIKGWVRNLADGRVEAVFEGKKDLVEQIIEWCHRGSPNAQVTKVEVSDDQSRQVFSGFNITG